MFYKEAIDNAIDIDRSHFHFLSCWFHPKPYALMSTSCRNSCHHPFILCNLLLDGQVEIWVGVANSKNMLLSPFKSDRIPDVIMDFNIIGRDELGQQVYITCVNDFLVVASDKQFVFFARQEKPPSIIPPNG